MSKLSYRLSLPASISADELIGILSGLHQAAKLLPVFSVHSLLYLDADQIGTLLALDDGPDGIAQFLRLDLLDHGSGQDAPRPVTYQPGFARGFAVHLHPQVQWSRLDLMVALYGPNLTMRDGSDASGWIFQGECETARADTDLPAYLMAHLSATALLDSAADLGIRVQVEDDTGFGPERRLETLMNAYPGSDPRLWGECSLHLESLRNLADLVHAVDAQVLPTESH